MRELTFMLSVSILSSMALPITSSFAQMAPMYTPDYNQTDMLAYPQIIHPSKEMIDARNKMFGYETKILGNGTEGNASNISPAAFGSNKCVNWLQNSNGTNDVYIQCSYDFGVSWSNPISLTAGIDASNLVSCGSARVFSNAWQQLNSTTERNEIWGTVSFDGGRTFGAPEQLSPLTINGSAHDPVMIPGDCEWVYYTITYENGTSRPAAWPW
jgi:hypothetical protein